MPWQIRQNFQDCSGWAVVQESNQRVVGCHETREQALRQLAALNANATEEAMPKNEVLMRLALAEGQRKITGAQLFPIGVWNHPRGKIEITPERAQRFVEQFKRGVAGQRLPILYIHSDPGNVANPHYGKAAGWITDMRADPEQGVLVDIEFTEEGAKAVYNKEYQYLSAEYFDKVQLPHHSRPEADVLVGAALVNRPHLKGMRPILNEETGHQFLMGEAKATKEGGSPVDPILRLLAEQAGVELQEDAESLTDEQRESIKQWLDSQATSLAEATGKIGLLEQRLADLEDPTKAKARSLAEAGFAEEAKLLSEYRADRLVRQLSEHLPEGKKLTPVAEQKLREYATSGEIKAFQEAMELVLAGKGVVDLTERGTQSGADEGNAPAEVGERLVTLATKRAKEDDIPWSQAMELVVAENPQLWNEYQLSMGSRKAVMEGGS